MKNNAAQLTLLQMDPATPPAPETSPLPPSPAHQPTPQGGQNSWQQTFAGIFFYKYKNVTGEFCKLGFGALKKMLTQHAEKYWVDHDTGAPEIPSVEAWRDEVEAFFHDEFAAKERGFHFSYLLKQFGSFKKFEPVKRTSQDDVNIIYACTKCGTEMTMPRSRWLQHRNKTGKCTKCGTQFNVNDVLNQPVRLNNYLPQL
ncbi:MAG: hypothetical protein AB1600_03320 [Bacteroidota bacterium]